MSQFTLSIKLGNSAMQTSYDVANALENTIRTLRVFPSEFEDGHAIKDVNGNTVGS